MLATMRDERVLVRRAPSCRAGAVIVVVVSVFGGMLVSAGSSQASAEPQGIHRIKHVVVIMQENRSFDSYFGTYPGADGIPMRNRVSTVCLPNRETGQCVVPYADHADVNGGGPHGRGNAILDIHGGKMDGFVNQAVSAKRGCADPTNPACAHGGATDVMGYHTRSDIPNYWTYAQRFVLQDRMFEPNASWSLPQHLFLVSEWSALCSKPADPFSCKHD